MRLLLALSFSLLLTPLAYADSTFYFSGYAPNGYNGYGGIDVAGTFDAAQTSAPGVWTVDKVYGTVAIDNHVYGIVPTPVPATPGVVSTADGFLFDDLFYTNPGAAPGFAVDPVKNGFDYWGLLFDATGTAGSVYVNLFENNFGNGVVAVYADTLNAYTNNAYFETTPVTLTTVVGPTPEPSSLILLGTGALGAALTLRRKMAGRAA
jgi:hypothetical protein